jgi:hypothetical protein
MDQLFVNREFIDGIKAADYNSRIETLTSGAVIYMAIYLVYLIAMFLILRFALKFDLVFGCI